MLLPGRRSSLVRLRYAAARPTTDTARAWRGQRSSCAVCRNPHCNYYATSNLGNDIRAEAWL
eukprot:5761479-Pleurochrysis_carterae.AAC.1